MKTIRMNFNAVPSIVPSDRRYLWAFSFPTLGSLYSASTVQQVVWPCIVPPQAAERGLRFLSRLGYKAKSHTHARA